MGGHGKPWPYNVRGWVEGRAHAVAAGFESFGVVGWVDTASRGPTTCGDGWRGVPMPWPLVLRASGLLGGWTRQAVALRRTRDGRGGMPMPWQSVLRVSGLLGGRTRQAVSLRRAGMGGGRAHVAAAGFESFRVVGWADTASRVPTACGEHPLGDLM